MNITVPADHRVKLKESEKNDKYLDLDRELKKTVERESEDYTKCKLVLSVQSPKDWYKDWTSGNHPNYSIIEIVQNTEESPGDLRRHVVTKTLVKDHQLALM